MRLPTCAWTWTWAFTKCGFRHVRKSGLQQAASEINNNAASEISRNAASEINRHAVPEASSSAAQGQGTCLHKCDLRGVRDLQSAFFDMICCTGLTGEDAA
jgi:hypothetical protein